MSVLLYFFFFFCFSESFPPPPSIAAQIIDYANQFRWEWRIFFPISKEEFVDTYLLKHPDQERPAKIRHGISHDNLSGMNDSPVSASPMESPTGSANSSVTSSAPSSSTSSGPSFSSLLATASSNSANNFVLYPPFKADLWNVLDIELTKEQKQAKTEDRLDEYLCINDNSHGLKLRNQTLLEVKVLHDFCSENPDSTPNEQQDSHFMEKWEKSLIVSLSNFVASEHTLEAVVSPNALPLDQLQAQLCEVREILKQRKKFDRPAREVDELIARIEKAMETKLRATIAAREADDDIHVVGESSNNLLLNIGAQSTNHCNDPLSECGLLKVGFHKLRLQCMMKNIPVEQTDLHIALSNHSGTLEGRQDYYFRSICVEGPDRDKVLRFLKEELLNKRPPGMSEQEPFREAGIGGGDHRHEIQVLGYRCEPMGYPEFIIRLLQYHKMKQQKRQQQLLNAIASQQIHLLPSSNQQDNHHQQQHQQQSNGGCNKIS